MPLRRRVAPLTALLAGWPPVQRLTSSGPQRDIARADGERTIRGRSVRGRAAHAIRPAFGEHRSRDSDATAPTASPPESQRTRLENAGDAEPEPLLRTRLKDPGAAELEPQAAPCSVCRQTHRYSAVYTLFVARI
jgi:hypothetical protein